MDKLIEKWLKSRSDEELYSLHALITDKDEQLWNRIGQFAFSWVTNQCNELSELKNLTDVFDTEKGKDIKSENTVNAQLDCIERYRNSGICVRCKTRLSGIVAEYEQHRDKNPDVHPIEALFLTIHGYSGLCTDCIGKFLLDQIAK